MKKQKRTEAVEITHFNGDKDSIAKGNMVLAEIERKETAHFDVDGGMKYVPFHAVQLAEVTSSNSEVIVDDNTCYKGCNSMEEPVVDGDMQTLTVKVGEEFDPTDGITAYDDNGRKVNVTVEVEGE